MSKRSFRSWLSCRPGSSRGSRDGGGLPAAGSAAETWVTALRLLSDYLIDEDVAVIRSAQYTLRYAAGAGAGALHALCHVAGHPCIMVVLPLTTVCAGCAVSAGSLHRPASGGWPNACAACSSATRSLLSFPPLHRHSVHPPTPSPAACCWAPRRAGRHWRPRTTRCGPSWRSLPTGAGGRGQGMCILCHPGAPCGRLCTSTVGEVGGRSQQQQQQQVC